MNNVDIFNICLAKKLSGGGGGTYESKSVTPDFSSGDITVSPDEGYDALSSVTIEKDADLIAENIKKDVNVFGIVGTLEGGGGDSQLDALIDGSATTISSATVTSVGENSFYGHKNITSVDFPNVTELGLQSFYNCTGLVSFNLPKVTVVGDYAFYNCTNLSSASVPSATTLKQVAFYGCTSLLSMSLPNVTTVGTSVFANCSNLSLIVFDKLTSLNSGIFNNCANLSTLVLKSDVLCTIPATSVFNGTSFASGKAGGTLYVPQDLVASYQANNKWSSVLSGNENNKILAIEGSPYENP